MDRKAISTDLVIVLVSMAVVGPVAWSMGDGPVDIFRKISFVPVFQLALRGVFGLFPNRWSRSDGILSPLTFVLLTASLTSVYLVFLATPADAESLEGMLRKIVFTTIGMTAIMMVVFRFAVPRDHPRED